MKSAGRNVEEEDEQYKSGISSARAGISNDDVSWRKLRAATTTSALLIERNRETALMTSSYLLKKLVAATMTSSYLLKKLVEATMKSSYLLNKLVAATMTSSYLLKKLVAATVTSSYLLYKLMKNRSEAAEKFEVAVNSL
ncbi:pentatricopeptide repeat-containing protein [Dorcoceras hygrometricum]|uniref:Pentatricopeptide repeat-containing protein n=1 Tax=Dorcoceras hygrometricum TaxID=472368 RepID=A0A2Z7AT89_9LAMI|nr:pentatricopeptide repeat-containing protein [Dorcoceras hygrometricum]